MSNIIKFPLEKVQRRSGPPIDKNQPAEILIFEGIQYQNEEREMHNLSNLGKTN